MKTNIITFETIVTELEESLNRFSTSAKFVRLVHHSNTEGKRSRYDVKFGSKTYELSFLTLNGKRIVSARRVSIRWQNYYSDQFTESLIRAMHRELVKTKKSKGAKKCQ